LIFFVGSMYKNSIDCLRQTVKAEGFFALYKGFLPVWLRLGPWYVFLSLNKNQLNHFPTFRF